MKYTTLILLVIVLTMMQLSAQDSLMLRFVSDKNLDSIRIENINNGSSGWLRDSEQIVFSFNDEVDIDTSTFMSLNYPGVKQPLIYPNPCKGKTHLRFDTNGPVTATLSVCDIKGRELSRMNQDIIRGSHHYEIKLDESGVFFVNIRTPSEVISHTLINTGGSKYDPGIEYTGMASAKDYYFPSCKSALFKNDSTASLSVEVGDLLRFSGYSGQSLEMFYDILDQDSVYQFTFPPVDSGVYLILNDTIYNGLDTLYCLAKRDGYMFSFDTTGSEIFKEGNIMILPVTFGGTTSPNYTLEIENQEIWMLDSSVYTSGEMTPLIPRADTSVIILHDESNNFSREFVFILVADEFVGPGVPIAVINNDKILDEISGMAASIKNPGCFWVHNDSGDEARLFLINTEGLIVSIVNIDTDYDYTDNRDWEDIAVGPGPIVGESYIYIGEIGDLDRKYETKYIFRLIEPQVNTSILNGRLNIGKEAISTITFDYHDGSRDAEILMIDPVTKDLFIVTKREERVQIYELSYPQNFNEKVFLTKSSVTLPFRLANGGDISADGKEILIKNLTNVYYWKREEGESVQDALARPAEVLPYTKEPQGEAIAWLRNGTAYLTVSEKRDGIIPVLYKYKRRW